MSDSILNIIINTVKRGGGDKEALTGVKRLSSGFKELTGISLGSASALGIAGMATSKLIDLVKSSITETEQYVTSVTDQARMLGIDVEEMSRFIQAADDVFISQEKLEKAMQAATRNGLDVSREGMKRLSDEYLALDPKMERGQWLMQNFGKSGADMGKWFELGGDGIDAAMDSVSKSLLVTEQSRQNIENYKRSIDNFNDSWQGVKYTIGNEVIPELDLLLRVLTKGKDDVELHEQAINRLEGRMEKLAGAAAFGNKSAKAALEETLAELEKLRAAGPGVGSAVGSIAGDLGLVTQYFKDLTAEMIFNHLAANMDASAQMNLALQMGMINRETYVTLTELDELTAKYDTNGDGVISLTEKTRGYNEELATIKGYQDALADKTVTYTIHMKTEIADLNIGNDELQAGQDINGNGIIGKARGGTVTRNEPYIVGEEGMEVFVPNQSGTIIPNNALGGNTYYFNFNGAPLAEIMRQLKLQGVGR